MQIPYPIRLHRCQHKHERAFAEEEDDGEEEEGGGEREEEGCFIHPLLSPRATAAISLHWNAKVKIAVLLGLNQTNVRNKQDAAGGRRGEARRTCRGASSPPATTALSLHRNAKNAMFLRLIQPNVRNEDAAGGGGRRWEGTCRGASFPRVPLQNAKQVRKHNPKRATRLKIAKWAIVATTKTIASDILLTRFSLSLPTQRYLITPNNLKNVRIKKGGETINECCDSMGCC